MCQDMMEEKHREAKKSLMLGLVFFGLDEMREAYAFLGQIFLKEIIQLIA